MCSKKEFIDRLKELDIDNLKCFYQNVFLKLQEFLKSQIKQYKMKEEFDYIDRKNVFKYTLTFFEIEKNKVDILKDLGPSGSLFVNGYKITIQIDNRIKDNSRYMIVSFSKYKNLYFNENDVYLEKLDNVSTILINDDLTIFTNEIKGRMLPLTFSSLSKIINNFKIFESIVNYILLLISEDKIFPKEIIKEYAENQFYLPIKINDIVKCHNKRELIKLYLKNENIPKIINKFSLLKGYLLIKGSRYIEENEFQKLYILKDLEFIQWHMSIKESVIGLLTLYYEKILGVKDDEYYEDKVYIITDYIRMKLMSDDKILNLKIKSYRRLLEEHDKLAIKLRYKETKTIKIPKDSKFKNLKLSNDFEEIKTRKRIIEESVKQNNCVWSYAEDINKDKCRIYSTMYKGKRYTLEIRKRKNKFILVQLRGVCNSSAPIELHEKIKNILKEIS